MFIDKAHTSLGIFPVFLPCMLPTTLCSIFYFIAFLYTFQLNVVILIVRHVKKLNVRNLIGGVIGKEINVFLKQVSLSLGRAY